MNDTIIDSLTREWIEMFENPKNRRGIFWELALLGQFPEGVDTNNPKVIEILKVRE